MLGNPLVGQVRFIGPAKLIDARPVGVTERARVAESPATDPMLRMTRGTGSTNFNRSRTGGTSPAYWGSRRSTPRRRTPGGTRSVATPRSWFLATYPNPQQRATFHRGVSARRIMTPCEAQASALWSIGRATQLLLNRGPPEPVAPTRRGHGGRQQPPCHPAAHRTRSNTEPSSHLARAQQFVVIGHAATVGRHA